MRSLHILLVHQNFPGQFRDLSPAWVSRGMQISAVGSTSSRIPGVSHHPYHPPPGLNRGLALRRHLQRLAELDGLLPDLVIAHSGWGEALPIKAVWPHTPLVVYPELWGSPLSLGVGFDPLQPALSADQLHALRHHNRRTARALQQADAAVAPTAFQRNSFPPPWRERITLIHEGVNCQQHQPNPDASLLLPNGVHLTRRTPVITYVSRAFEPLRGLRSFLAALPPLLAADPLLQVVMVGGEGKGYGPAADQPHGASRRYYPTTSWTAGFKPGAPARGTAARSAATPAAAQQCPCVSHLSLCPLLERAGSNGLRCAGGG